MDQPIKAYAVSSGEYSDYYVHAIFRRREDAERYMAQKFNWGFVEEFDYYEGEPTPKPVMG